MKNTLIFLLVICPALSFSDGYQGRVSRVRELANVHTLKSNQFPAARVFHAEHLIAPLMTPFTDLFSAAKSRIRYVSAIFEGFFRKSPIQCPGSDKGSASREARFDPVDGGQTCESRAVAGIASNALSKQAVGAGAGGDDPDDPDRGHMGKKLPADELENTDEEEEINNIFEMIKKCKGKNEAAILDLIKKYLKGVGHSVNDTDRQMNTLLHVLSEYGYVEAVRYLLEHGADPNLCNSFCDVPLVIALESDWCKGNREKIVELLIDFDAELNTKFVDEDGAAALTPLDVVADPELSVLMYHAHQERRFAVLQRIWQQLPPELQEQFRKEFSCIARWLDVIDLQEIDERLLSSADADARIKELLKEFDPEYLLSQLLMQIIQGILNFEMVAFGDVDEWFLVERAGFLLIEYFRELSLSSVDVAGDYGIRGFGRQFESFFQERGGIFIKRLNRMPYTLSAVLRPDRKIFLGRTASRNMQKSSSRECSSRCSSAPDLMRGRLSSLSSRSGGPSECSSVQGSRTPQQCGEFEAFANALRDDHGSDEPICSFASVEIQDLVCRYGFNHKKKSEPATPRNKPPCMNCRVLYADHRHAGKTVREQYFIHENTHGVITHIEECEEIPNQIDNQVIAFIKILVNGSVIEAEVRVSRDIFIQLRAGSSILFDLLSDARRPLMIIRGLK